MLQAIVALEEVIADAATLEMTGGVVSPGGALATPVLFILFGWLHSVLGDVEPAELSFRPDREIRRGR